MACDGRAMHAPHDMGACRLCRLREAFLSYQGRSKALGRKHRTSWHVMAVPCMHIMTCDGRAMHAPVDMGAHDTGEAHHAASRLHTGVPQDASARQGRRFFFK